MEHSISGAVNASSVVSGAPYSAASPTIAGVSVVAGTPYSAAGQASSLSSVAGGLWVGPGFEGEPIMPFLLRPNWAEKYTLGTQYRTIIHEALDLSEERNTKTERCLYALAFTALAGNQRESQYGRRFIEFCSDGVVAVPFWHDEVTLTGDFLAGETSIEVTDTAGTLFRPLYQYALIFQDLDNWEIVNMVGVAPYFLYLARPTEAAWAEGTSVFPLAFGTLRESTGQSFTDEVTEFSVEFREIFQRFLSSLLPQPQEEKEVEADNDLEVTYSVCKDQYTISFPPMKGASNYEILFSDSAIGPWKLYWISKQYLTPDPPVPGLRWEFTLNNESEGNKWIKVVGVMSVFASIQEMLDNPGDDSVGPRVSGETHPVKLLAPNIPIPAISLTGDIRLSGGQVTDFGWSELGDPVQEPYAFKNDRINTGETIHRYQQRFETDGADYFNTTTADFTFETEAGVTVKAVLTLEDPTLASPDLHHAGVLNRLGVGWFEWNCVLKWRGFKDGCRSPMGMVLIDSLKHQELETIPFVAYTPISLSCQMPNPGAPYDPFTTFTCLDGPYSSVGQMKQVGLWASMGGGAAVHLSVGAGWALAHHAYTTSESKLPWTGYRVHQYSGSGASFVSIGHNRVGALDWDLAPDIYNTWVGEINDHPGEEIRVSVPVGVGGGGHTSDGLMAAVDPIIDVLVPIKKGVKRTPSLSQSRILLSRVKELS